MFKQTENINWDKTTSTTAVNHNTTSSLHCSFINGCEPGDEDQAGCWFLVWTLREWLLLPRCLTLHYSPVLSEVLSSWVGGCLVQTLSSHRLHVDTLFYNHMKFSEQLATCGSSGGVFHQRSVSLFRDMTDKTRRKWGWLEINEGS